MADGSKGPGRPFRRAAARVAVRRAKAGDRTRPGPTRRTVADLTVPDRSVDRAKAAPPGLDRAARVSAGSEPRVVRASSVTAVARTDKDSRANDPVASPGPAAAARDPAGSPGRDRAVSGQTARAATSKEEYPIERAVLLEIPGASGRPATRGRRGRRVNSVRQAVDRGPVSAMVPDSARPLGSAAHLKASGRLSVKVARAGQSAGRVLGRNTGASGHVAKASRHATKTPRPATSPLSRGRVAPNVARMASPGRARAVSRRARAVSAVRVGALRPACDPDLAKAAVSRHAQVLATHRRHRSTARSSV
jgi:hypothetical protein